MTKQRQTAETRRAPTRQGVIQAAKSVASVVPPTPLLTLDVAGARVFAKAESMQPVGAFKLRGAWWRLSSMTDRERARGVVAFSSGNHAQGVAWAARRLGIAATIVMPSDAPRSKIVATRVLGADVILYDRATESREAIAGSLAHERGAVLVPSFDDPWIVEGQGSAGIEATAQMAALGVDPPDLIVACCGGGGLAAGLALACPDAQIIVVEPEGWDDMTCSLELGTIVPVTGDPPPTACDALMTRRVAELTFGILNECGARGVVVSEYEIEEAVRYAFATLRIVLEPGGAVALAAILSAKVTPSARTLITLSGGNIDPTAFAEILGRAA